MPVMAAFILLPPSGRENRLDPNLHFAPVLEQVYSPHHFVYASS